MLQDASRSRTKSHAKALIDSGLSLPAEGDRMPAAFASAPVSSSPDRTSVVSDYDPLLDFHGIEPDRLVLLHPAFQGEHPAWPVEHYAQVADQLAADGWQIAIVGQAREPERNGAVLGEMQAAALFLAGALSNDMLARLIRDARFVLSDDAASPALAHDTPQCVIADVAAHMSPETVAAEISAALHRQSAAHPGRPFTLHMPAMRHAA
jgi:Glycosyltransferase family 9 (heptosyltransferase)